MRVQKPLTTSKLIASNHSH